MKRITPLDLVGFPRLYRFHRPFWAYDYLGWSLLREHLFGQSWRLTEGLDEMGDRPINTRQLAHLMDEAHTPMTVRSQIVVHLHGMTASEFAAWYRDWEDEVFETYVARERDIENRMLGKYL